MTTLDGDVLVTGTLVPTYFVAPANSVGDGAVSPTASIQYSKLEHMRKFILAQPSTQVAAAETRTVLVASASGAVLGFEAGSISPCTGNATITLDLKKNGSSILSAAITLDNAKTARQVVAGIVQTAAFVDGDVFEIVITVNAGTGALGSGVFASLIVKEKAA